MCRTTTSSRSPLRTTTRSRTATCASRAGSDPSTSRTAATSELMGRVTVRKKVLRIRDSTVNERVDTLVAEEPLEIRVNGAPLSVTMRTPGHDFDLAVGFLAGEGVVHRAEDIRAIRYCAGATEDGANTYNVLDVDLASGVAPPDASVERNFYTTSSCGLCGKASLDAVRTKATWSVA